MLPETLARHVEQALRNLAYGSIHLVVHEAQVVRIERIERIKLTGSPEAAENPRGRPTDSPEVHRAQQEA